MRLYRQYVIQNGTPVPESEWQGQQVELKCNAFQIVVAKNVGAPESEVTYLASLDGTGDDIDGDGNVSWLEFWARDW